MEMSFGTISPDAAHSAKRADGENVVSTQNRGRSWLGLHEHAHSGAALADRITPFENRHLVEIDTALCQGILIARKPAGSAIVVVCDAGDDAKMAVAEIEQVIGQLSGRIGVVEADTSVPETASSAQVRIKGMPLD